MKTTWVERKNKKKNLAEDQDRVTLAWKPVALAVWTEVIEVHMTWEDVGKLVCETALVCACATGRFLQSAEQQAVAGSRQLTAVRGLTAGPIFHQKVVAGLPQMTIQESGDFLRDKTMFVLAQCVNFLGRCVGIYK